MIYKYIDMESRSPQEGPIPEGVSSGNPAPEYIIMTIILGLFYYMISLYFALWVRVRDIFHPHRGRLCFKFTILFTFIHIETSFHEKNPHDGISLESICFHMIPYNDWQEQSDKFAEWCAKRPGFCNYIQEYK